MDKREAILARLAALCTAISGIVSAQRNVLDVPYLQRPAVVVQDGSEERLDSPASATRSTAQRMELSPQLWLLVRGSGAEAGALLSLYRSRIVQAVLTDTTLQDLTGTAGGIRYEGCNVPEPTPESKEPRLDLNFTLTYTLRLSDLEG
ncbi:MAG TPA: hypothetical protein VHM22_18530 [Bradyrhizobium sp.]|nr:hypothetical protein [Bradyrhizobium sp.]